ncbi:MAG: hypothetical protein H6926_06745 [Chromatiales bacterium]|nr:hypothetical protein [Gammaproteobacteria bacterium]MCP5352869.1 hypothetical protein [Chromatiales bacterium]
MQAIAHSAGMSKVSYAAPFLRWNMPYTSGGLLTDKEALDLACFIDAQPRPGKLRSGTDEPEVCLP